MKLKWQDNWKYIDLIKIKNTIHRYLRRYADFDKFINTLPAVTVTENNNYKLIKYNRTNAFILINYKIKSAGFFKIIRGYNRLKYDKHFIQFVCSLYNEKDWNIIYKNTDSENTFKKYYDSALALVTTGTIKEHNTFIDSIAIKPEKLKMLAKVKNLHFNYYNDDLFLEPELYNVPYRTVGNYYTYGTKLKAMANYSTYPHQVKNTTLFVAKSHKVMIAFNKHWGV